MITLEDDFLDGVGVDVPKVAAYVLVAHVGEEIHILADLVVILWFGGTELEVDDDPLVTVGHYTVRTMLAHLTVFKRENRALVKERPMI